MIGSGNLPHLCQKMTELMINGVPVSFPFEPYPVQRTYMEKVIECLQKSCNGLLESPTGTGKTLSLLCSALGWLLVKKAHMQISVMSEGNLEMINGLQNKLHDGVGAMKDNEKGGTWGMPKIIYASRTHAQLTQAIQELKRTKYNHVRVTVLGSRDQLCIHPEVSNETSNANKVQLCRMHVNARTCSFYNNTDAKKEDPIFNSEGILDIEDLVQAGKKLRCCPYYVAKDMKIRADVIFAPYNYLLDPKTRRAQGIELLNNVVIFDEAHNIEKMCEESASLQIRSTDIALCIEEVTQVMRSISEDTPEQGFTQAPLSEAKDFGPEELTLLKTFFLELEKAVDDIPVGMGNDGTVHPGGFIFEVLATAGLSHSKKTVVLELIDKLVQFLSTTSVSPFQRKGTGLQKFADLLKVAFPGERQTQAHIDNINRCYKVHVATEVVKKVGKSDSWGAAPASAAKNAGRVLNYWCFSPGFGMQQLLEQGLRCVILTSGTLSPLPPLISELGIPIGVQLENPHVIQQNQVCVGVLGSGPDNFPLSSSFKSRSDPAYLASLGRTILNLCRVIPHGMLVFFSSYPIMRKCQEDWQHSGIWSQINEIKEIFVEPQGKSGFNEAMTGYYAKVHEGSGGACFMAVVRGKVSEGLDFADINGRAVIITGVPFPPFLDPRVVLKQKYLDETRGKNGALQCLSGQEWYQLEASRAVNQAVGRVIRHANDFGAILLCDHRFGNVAFRQRLSAWLRPHVTVFQGFGAATRTVREFFRAADKDLPPPKIKPLASAAPHARTVVSARFEEGGFRRVPARIPAVAPTKAKDNPEWSVSDYLAQPSTSQVSKSQTSKPQGLFEALNRTSSIIDFNSTAQSSHTSSSRPVAMNGTGLPVARPCKVLNLKPVNLEPTRELTCPCRGKTVDGLCSCKPPSSIGIPDQNKAAILNYLKQLKSALNMEDYLKFANAFRDYKKSGNYDEFMAKSTEIFVPVETRHRLLKDFARFIKREHLSEFQTFCSKLRGCKHR